MKDEITALESVLEHGSSAPSLRTSPTVVSRGPSALLYGYWPQRCKKRSL